MNLLGWASFLGLFVTGLIGLLGAWPQERREVNLAGAAYLLVGGLAFGSVLLLVLILRRGPKI